jgi:hypothetical protein
MRKTKSIECFHPLVNNSGLAGAAIQLFILSYHEITVNSYMYFITTYWKLYISVLVFYQCADF